MSVARSANIFRFGPDNSIVASITSPRTAGRQIGVVIWGMGVAEVRAARLFSKEGFVAMQIRQEGEGQGPLLDASGVARCTEAMNYLTQNYGVHQFILMGNCGAASICFNAALRDLRVTSLVLSNPHVSEVLTASLTYKSKLLNLRSWIKLLSGRVDMNYHRTHLRWLMKFLVGKLKRADEKQLISQFTYSKDVTIPANLTGKLDELLGRGINLLFIFSSGDPSLSYFKNKFGEDFTKLKSPQISIALLPSTTHVISLDDSAATIFNQHIATWVKQQLSTFALSTKQIDTAIAGNTI